MLSTGHLIVELPLSLCYLIRFSVVLRSYLLAALSFTTILVQGAGGGTTAVPAPGSSVLGLSFTGHWSTPRRACVIGVKCHGKELISSIIIIYGSLCVHLPQNTTKQEEEEKYTKYQQTIPKYKTQVRLFFKFVSPS